MGAIPIYGSIPAGLPGKNFSDASDVEFMPQWAVEFDRWGRVVKGDSMHPEFEDGDIAILENRRPLPNQIVHAIKDGDDTFKVLRPGPGNSGTFVPLNSDGHFPLALMTGKSLGF